MKYSFAALALFMIFATAESQAHMCTATKDLQDRIIGDLCPKVAEYKSRNMLRLGGFRARHYASMMEACRKDLESQVFNKAICTSDPGVVFTNQAKERLQVRFDLPGEFFKAREEGRL